MAAVLAGCLLLVSSSAQEVSQESVNVVLLADGVEKHIQTEQVSVAEVLARSKIVLGELDRVTPDLEQRVDDGTTIKVVRVRRQVVTRQGNLVPPTKARYDRRVGRPIVLHPGMPGLVSQLVKTYTKDGEVTQERVLQSHVLRQPVAKTIVVGRNNRRLPSRGGPPLIMVATAYDPGPRSCGKYASGRTAVGVKAGRGVVAVDPSVIPLGTRLYIDRYGEAVAADVGRAIRGRRIDLGFDTYQEARRFGRRVVRVYILD
jgi:3D (Asp-Asp-Asp) domain-containing protein